MKREVNIKDIYDIEVDGVDTRDYPDFCDAYIISAMYKGKPMTELELDELSQDGEFVNEAVFKQVY